MDKSYTNLLGASLLALFLHGTGIQAAVPPPSPGKAPAAANTVYSQTFDTEDDFLDFTIVDADGDKNQWKYDSEGKAALYRYSSGWDYRCSDYLVTPELQLKKNTKYTLQFHVRGTVGMTTFSGEYSALVGQGDDVSKYKTVVPVTEIRNNKGGVARDVNVTFTVEADGTYHLAFRISNDDSNASGGLTMTLDDINLTAANTSAPDAVTDLNVKAQGSSLKTIISFKTPTKSIDGSSLSAIGKIEVWRGATLIKTIDKPAPGALQTVEDNGPSAGNNIYKVIPYSESGASGEEATATVWVGADSPVAVAGLKLGRTDDGKALLEWQKPTAGTNGGFVDPNVVTYTVTRFPDNVVVSEGKTDNSFTDAIDPSKRNVYYYTVKAFNGSLAGEEATTEKCFFGKAFDLPYSESFDTDPADRYTIFDANHDGNTWIWDSYSKAMRNKYSWTDPADDWVLTPTLKLEGGWSYTLSFGAATGSTSEIQIEKLSVSFGKGGDVSTFKEIVPVTEYKGNVYIPVTKNFNVTESGDYQVGFHVTSDALKYGIYLDSVRVTKLVNLAAPDSVTNLKIVPAALGKLEATVSFTAPTQNVALNKLSEITKIEVYRTNVKGENLTLVNTFNAPKPGEQLSFTDKTPIRGFNVYYVRAFNSAGQGMASGAYEYIGEDVPNAPTDLSVTDNFDGTITLNWKAPAGNKGVNGKYVDTANLKYNVYNPMGELLQTTKPGVTTVTLTISHTGNQEGTHYTVRALSAGGESVDSEHSPEVMLGGYANLPFRDSFKGAYTAQQWWTSNDPSAMVGPYSEMSSDDDHGCYVLISAQTDVWANLTSGKIRTEDATNPRLAFSYYGTPDFNQSIELVAITPDYREIVLKKIDTFTDLDWHRVTLEVPNLAKEKYVRLQFRMKVSGAGYTLGMIAIDNIDFREMRDYDLAVSSFETPFKVNAGQGFESKVKVENFGLNTAEEGDYNVELYVDDEKVMETPGEELQPDATKEYSFSYNTNLGSTKPLKVYAKISYVSDLRPDNDQTETNTVTVRVPGYTKVDNLAANDGKLTWTQPEDQGNRMFEDYVHGQIDGYDPWTSHDFDGLNTIASVLCAQGNISYKDGPMAFQIFNPEKLGLNLDYNPKTVAHSGGQYMVSWGGYDDTMSKYVSHDDILISPELSGKAQTIRFWVKSMLARWDRAMDVLTSTTTNDYTAFNLDAPLYHDIEKPLDEVLDTYRWDNWTEYEIEIPEGTKYFAIRAYGIDKYTPNTAEKPGYMFMLDDVEYTAPSPAVTGYNVYRDDKKVGTVKVGQPLTFAAETGHRYNVTVLYEDGGESAYSNDASLTTGIDNAAASDNAVSVLPGDGKIVVRGAEGQTVSVFALNGSKVYSSVAAETTEIPVQRGQYIVRVGQTVKTVAVR